MLPNSEFNLDNLKQNENMLKQNEEKIIKTNNIDYNFVKTSDKLKSKLIILDSKDRDTETYPNSNNYTINFSKDNTKNGYVNDILDNIQSIELLECIITNSIMSDSPYILLEVEELSGSSFGTNKFINNSFATLSTYQNIGNYRYYSFQDKPVRPKITFDINKYLDKLTISFRDSHGKLLEFDENSNSQNSVTFNIIYEKLNLNNILNR